MSWLPRNRVVVPYDFSDESFEAISLGHQLVDEPGHLHVVHVLPELTATEPGVNIVQNGDFSQELDGWIWETPVAPASADWEIRNGQFHYIINNGGSVWSSVQLRQNGINLVQGRYYIFEFDAWADSPRIIEAKVGQDVSPWTNYSKINPTYITKQKKLYTY